MNTETASVQEVSEALRAWEAAINLRVVERSAEIRGLVLSAAAGVHMLQLGPPGTSKTYTVTTALDLVSKARTMSAQLHGFSVMEDLYGPVSLKLLDEDRHARKYEQYLPWADLAHIDEVYKANPTLLQSNLWLLNERKFRNDGDILSVPLISAFFTSNEGPQDKSLAAFDDRIHMRYEVGPIRDPENRIKMFKIRLAQSGPPEPVISIDTIRAANALVDKVEVPDEVLNLLNELHSGLATAKIHPTDRKMNDSLDVIRATAVYNGRLTATAEDIKHLDAMLWTNPRDRQGVRDVIFDLGNPIDKEAASVLAALEGLDAEYTTILQGDDPEPVKFKRLTELALKAEAAALTVNEVARNAIKQGLESDALTEAKQLKKNLGSKLRERIQELDKKIGK